MTKTLPIRFAGIALATFAFTACLAPEDSSEEEIDFSEVEAESQGEEGEGEPNDKDAPELGVCFHGATTEVVAIDINAPRCTLSQIYDVYDYAVQDSQWDLVLFLLNALDGNGLVQCRPYVDPYTGEDKWCADVVDRYQDDTPLVKGTEPDVNMRNYFIAYVGDADGSAEKLHWDTLIANGTYAAPPVELSEAGFILKDGQFVKHYNGTYSSRGYRLLKFDPRNCGHCGIYDGPGSYVLNSDGWTAVYSTSRWWPTLHTGCRLEREPFTGGSPVTWQLPSQTCLAEQNYQATSR